MRYRNMEISERVVQRLTEYLSILKDVNKYEENINSIELSKIMNTTSAQVRKDLSTFGEFGIRGKGYDISKLIEIIEDILGINKVTSVVLVGHGKMGEMLVVNNQVLGKGFEIVEVFEKDPKKIGKQVDGNLNLIIKNINDVKEILKEYPEKIETAILAVVKEQAQIAAEMLVSSGITAILNMTTYKLELPQEITVVDIDISAKLQELNFWRIFRKENN